MAESGAPFKDITIHITDPLGVSASVTVDASRYYSTLRALGAKGMWSGKLPPGGLRLPLANEEDFDWRLIGARRYADQATGEIMVYARGHVWKRREFTENKAKKMPAAVKYSRGAKPTDDPNIIEGDEASNFRYVTLIYFSGAGRKIEDYALPPRREP